MLYERRQLLLLSQSGFKQLLSESLTDKFHWYLRQLAEELQLCSAEVLPTKRVGYFSLR